MTKKKSENNFSESLAELEKLVEKFEQGQVDVEEGLNDFERALVLARALKERLAIAENKVVEIKKKFSDVVENNLAQSSLEM